MRTRLEIKHMIALHEEELGRLKEELRNTPARNWGDEMVAEAVATMREQLIAYGDIGVVVGLAIAARRGDRKLTTTVSRLRHDIALVWYEVLRGCKMHYYDHGTNYHDWVWRAHHHLGLPAKPILTLDDLPDDLRPPPGAF